MNSIQLGRVFILEPVREDTDLTALQEFGETRALFGDVAHPTGFPSSPPVLNTKLFEQELIVALEDAGFDPSVDAFGLVGRTTKIALAALVIARAFPKSKLRLLMYNGHSRRYEERTV